MRELGIPFTERLTPFSEASNWEAFRSFSPNGKVPCLHDKDESVWDSLAIAEYLAEQHHAVWPENRKARTWARCAAAEMHSGFATLRECCTMNCGIRVQLKDIPASLQKDIARIDELWSEGIDRFGGPFLAGNQFTAVDAFFAPVVFRVQTYGLALSVTASAYVTHLLALPSMRAWYEDALREPWREPGHEADAHATGTWLADLRAK
jgi:glutathione S-transferase